MSKKISLAVKQTVQDHPDARMTSLTIQLVPVSSNEKERGEAEGYTLRANMAILNPSGVGIAINADQLPDWTAYKGIKAAIETLEGEVLAVLAERESFKGIVEEL